MTSSDSDSDTPNWHDPILGMDTDPDITNYEYDDDDGQPQVEYVYDAFGIPRDPSIPTEADFEQYQPSEAEQAVRDGWDVTDGKVPSGGK